MITELHIKDLGVIEKADVAFRSGLTVLTGETGAGKTMVLTSLQLLLGQKAEAGVVRVGAQKAEVDGVFECGLLHDEILEDFCGDSDGDELILSRTVAAHGRSRGRIGGRPVPASQMAGIGEYLVTIHGQSDQLGLRKETVRRAILDALGDASYRDIREKYSTAWDRAVQIRKRRDDALTGSEEKKQAITELSRVINAISSLDLHEDEDEELRSEADRLTNISQLRESVGGALKALIGEAESQSVEEAFALALLALREGSHMDSQIASFAERVNSLSIELGEVITQCKSYLDGLETDPSRLEIVQQRRAQIRELLRGRATDVTSLLLWQDEARRQLNTLLDSVTDPDALNNELLSAQKEVIAVGKQLSEARSQLAQTFSARVEKELHGLAMPSAIFTVKLNSHKPGPHGLEDVDFLFTSFPDTPPRPLTDTASGGELSRIMLAVEVAGGSHDRNNGQTYIFDEVDSGIGGRTATEVGKRLAALAHNRQVIVVTHLAQVAAFADTHLLVEKKGATTQVKEVCDDERLMELARMMSGDEDSIAARQHAKELIDRSRATI